MLCSVGIRLLHLLSSINISPEGQKSLQKMRCTNKPMQSRKSSTWVYAMLVRLRCLLVRAGAASRGALLARQDARLRPKLKRRVMRLSIGTASSICKKRVKKR